MTSYLFTILFLFIEIMDLAKLCEALGVSDPTFLKVGFSTLFDLFPDSSCESIQLVNFLIPLVLELIKPFYHEDAMLQINQYFYVEVVFFRFSIPSISFF